ncbi:AAA family ATPase [Rhodococcus sp. KBS0724]|uniref:AAA family ATPase n=1 Tax=Rhodococcus sp. KBS0724 TaxID=1179674 RepID=UPI00110D8B48|nr:AAA family ATPase [Rhodococcus sp. KBS0724]TSD45021.1 AAA family ATPase [Rhodococcus sp. KBS0724]
MRVINSPAEVIEISQRHTEPEPHVLDGMVDGAWLDAQHFPPLQWSVQGIVPEGFGLIVAPPKAGKSWFVAGIGLACATGGLALGKISVSRRPVLYMALEDGHRRLQGRFRQILGEGVPIPKDLHVIVKAQPLAVVAMISEFLDRHASKAPLIILDTLGKVKPPKRAGEDAYTADYAIGTKLKDLVDAVSGSSLLVVHHTRKAESSDFVDAVSGTQGIAGSADFILVLARKRKSDDAVLAVTGRDVPENEYALTTSDGRWSLDGMDLTDAAATVENRQQKTALADRSMEILRFVSSRPETTAKDVEAEFTDINNNDAGTYLRRLHEAGHINKPRRGTYSPVSEPSEVSERYESAGHADQGEPSVSDASHTSDTSLFADSEEIA